MPKNIPDLQNGRTECYNKMLLWGLSEGLVFPYDDKLIEKLRTTYEGGIPGSLILLSTDLFSIEESYRALILARALIDEEEDLEILYLENNSIKDGASKGHCVVERTTTDGKHYIYDTYNGLMFERKMYTFLEESKVTRTIGKDAIIAYTNQASRRNPERFLIDKNAISIVMPILEKSLEKEPKFYEKVAHDLLKTEVEFYKEVIDYKKCSSEDAAGNDEAGREHK